MKDKQQIRTEIRAVLAAMDPARAARSASEATSRLIAQREFTDARSVMIFIPSPGEIDARQIARAAWSAGKRVAVPKIRAPGVMDAIEIHSLETDLAPGTMNIMEPVGNNLQVLGELDLIVAPAMAFDRRGNRLGRGGGYYDRFIDEHSGSLIFGLGFSEQLLDELPIEPHDRPVNLIATNNELLRLPRNVNR